MTKEIVFQGVDASGKNGLWISDGTAAGTAELTGITGAATTGLAPAYFQQLGTMLTFAGVDSAGHTGLWVTQGTAATTKELTVSGADAKGLDPTHLTGFSKTEELFNGVDTAGHHGLWVTDGTAAGTKEITVAGASTDGLDPRNGFGGSGVFAVIGKEAYFVGTDSKGNEGLWKSDGTAAGTQEITGIAGSPSVESIHVLNGKLVLSGKVGSSWNIYVSDGTATGTKELTGISGARSDALGGIHAENLRHVGDKMLFSGIDSGNNRGLWVTDGTAAGTTEIKSFGASSPTNITAMTKTTAVFAVKNASGNFDLYVTDGTAAGTKELTGITGANAKGILSGEHYPQLVMHDGEIYFAGLDSSGKEVLWETDGTVAGTKELGSITGASSKGLDPSHFANIGKPGTSGSSSSKDIAALSSSLFDAHFGGGSAMDTSHATGQTAANNANALAPDILGDAAHTNGAHG